MIVLGNPSLVLGMKLAGIRDAYTIRNKEEARRLIKQLPKNELIIANASMLDLVPELDEFENLVTIPDEPSEFGSVRDLKNIIKAAIGFEIKME